jgi:hypothetical protein
MLRARCDVTRLVLLGVLWVAGCETTPLPPPLTSSSTGVVAGCEAVVTECQSGDDATVYVDWLVTEVRDAAGSLVLETIEDRLEPSAGMGWRTTYDAAGQRAAVEYLDWLGVATEVVTWTYTYDLAGRIATVHFLSTDGTEILETYTYDALDRVVDVHSDGQQSPGLDGVVDQIAHYTYDPAGWVASIEHTAPAVVGWSWLRTYDPRGLMTSMVDYENFEAWNLEQWEYDAVGNPVRHERDWDADGETELVWTWTWTYDPQDLPLLQQLDQDEDGAPDSEISYAYDAAGLLVAMDRADLSGGPGWTSWAVSRAAVSCP